MFLKTLMTSAIFGAPNSQICVDSQDLLEKGIHSTIKISGFLICFKTIRINVKPLRESHRSDFYWICKIRTKNALGNAA
jgi:hypothetical protein